METREVSFDPHKGPHLYGKPWSSETSSDKPVPCPATCLGREESRGLKVFLSPETRTG